MDERLLIRQQWYSLRRDLDRYRSRSGDISLERTILRESLVTRLEELRKRLVVYYSSDPHTIEELRCGRGLLALESVVRRATDKLIPEEELHGTDEHGKAATE